VLRGSRRIHHPDCAESGKQQSGKSHEPVTIVARIEIVRGGFLLDLATRRMEIAASSAQPPACRQARIEELTRTAISMGYGQLASAARSSRCENLQ
jgi:hypothetical protein